MRKNTERYNLSRSELQHLIDQWIFNERHRIILSDRLFNGTTYERLAEKYDLSTQPMPMQSYSAQPMEQVETYIETTGDSEFLKAVDGRKSDKVWKLVDELVEAVKILHPRMYTTFIDKVQDL